MPSAKIRGPARYSVTPCSRSSGSIVKSIGQSLSASRRRTTVPVSMTRLTGLFRKSSVWKASNGALFTSTAEPAFHRKRWPMICGCSVSTNKPTSHIGIPQQRRRSQSSPKVLDVSVAGRAPLTSQSTIVFVSQFLMAPHGFALSIADYRDRYHARVPDIERPELEKLGASIDVYASHSGD